MSVLLLSSDLCLEHLVGPGHPERPARLGALAEGVRRADLGRDLSLVEVSPAPIEAVVAVHGSPVVDTVASLVEAGGGRVDADTVVSPGSLAAARLAAGAGLDAIDHLRAGSGSTAFCAIRPPGHHATSHRSMGFCLFNNVAVAARRLIDEGERVLIIDYDAHHGNGTQDIFYADPRVLFVSFHQFPAYPGTGHHHEIGVGDGTGTTVNVPLPPGATGDVYLRAWDDIVAPRVDRFAPTWVLVSAGFDAHRADPITDMGLSAGDFVALTARILEIAPKQRSIFFLEGGYDLDALTESAAGVLGALAGATVDTEAQTSGGPGAEIVGVLVDEYDER